MSRFFSTSNFTSLPFLGFALLAGSAAQLTVQARLQEEGVFFRIFDAEAPNRLSVETKPTPRNHALACGRNNIRRLAAHAVELIEIRVIRRPSTRFDNQIGGTVWMDEITLARIA